jgi:hypothetical protein
MEPYRLTVELTRDRKFTLELSMLTQKPWKVILEDFHAFLHKGNKMPCDFVFK